MIKQTKFAFPPMSLLLLLLICVSTVLGTIEDLQDKNSETEDLSARYLQQSELYQYDYLASGITPQPYLNCIPSNAISGSGTKKGAKKKKLFGKRGKSVKMPTSEESKVGTSKVDDKVGKGEKEDRYKGYENRPSAYYYPYGYQHRNLRPRRRHRNGYNARGRDYGEQTEAPVFQKEGDKGVVTDRSLPLCPVVVVQVGNGRPLGPVQVGNGRPFGPVPTLSPIYSPPSITGKTAVPTSSGASPIVGIPTVPLPSVAPGLGVTNAPSPAATTRVLVESTLRFGFFNGTNVTDPTQEEISGLLNQTSAFYTGVVRMQFPSLRSFEATFVNKTFNPMAAEFPVVIDFNANAFFPNNGTFRDFRWGRISFLKSNKSSVALAFICTSTIGTAPPSSGQVFRAMQSGDYQSTLKVTCPVTYIG